MANGIPYELKAPDPNWLASYIGYITFCKTQLWVVGTMHTLVRGMSKTTGREAYLSFCRIANSSS